MWISDSCENLTFLHLKKSKALTFPVEHEMYEAQTSAVKKRINLRFIAQAARKVISRGKHIQKAE